ncbi:acyl-CoA N-acyltransferase [Mycena polygramma]|nr:acyl-CoA N-acyltransferase [Mycena polygramma]
MLFFMADDPELALSPMHSHDIPAVMQLHSALLPVPYPFSFFLHLTLQPTRLCLVARSRGDPVAFISAALHRGHGIEILTLGVHPTFQQRRLATRLVYAVAAALDRKTAAATVFAHVSASNSSAKEFYKHMGMHPVARVSRDIYRALPSGSRDAYIVSGRIETRARSVVCEELK